MTDETDIEINRALRTTTLSTSANIPPGSTATVLRRDPNRIYAMVALSDPSAGPFQIGWDFTPSFGTGLPLSPDAPFYEWDIRKSGSLCQGELIGFDSGFVGGGFHVVTVRLPTVTQIDTREDNLSPRSFGPSDRVNADSLRRLERFRQSIKDLRRQIRRKP